MKNKENKKESFFVSDCVICKNKFRSEDFILVSKDNNKSIFHITCSNCLTSSIFVLLSEERNILGAGSITDLGREEVKEKLKMKPINADEMIEIYQQLFRV